MASVTLAGVQDRWPTGTVVGAYPASNWPATSLPPSGPAPGSATASGTVSAAGALVITGLAEDTHYYLGASVSGTWRYVGVSAGDLQTTDGRLDALEGGAADLVSNPAALIEGAEARYSLVRDRWEAVNPFTVFAAAEGMSAGASGTTNYNALMNAIVRIPANVPGRVLLPGGDLAINGRPNIGRSLIWIEGQGKDSTFLVQEDFAGSFLYNVGSVGTPKPLTGNATVGTTTLSFNTTGIVAGDYLKLYSDEAHNSEGDSETLARGEFVRVLTVDSASQVTLYKAIRDTYTVVTAASVCKPTWRTATRLSDFSLRSATPDTSPWSDLIRFDVALRPLIERVRTYSAYGQGIVVLNSIEPTIVAADALDLKDDGATGYGIAFGSATTGGVVLGPRARKVRHAFTTAGVTTPGFQQAGPVWDCLVAGGVALDCSNASWDTHTNAENIDFVGNKSIGSVSAGHSLRGRNCRILNAHSQQDALGCRVWAAAHGFEVRGLKVVNAKDRGIALYHSDDGVLDGAQIDGAGESMIYIAGVFSGKTRKMDRLTIRNVKATNWGQDPLAARKSGLYVASDMPASTGWLVENVFGEYVASPTRRNIPSGIVPDYLVRNEATALTGSDFRNLTCRGGMATIKDLGGNRRRNNRNLDKTLFDVNHNRPGVLATTFRRDSGALGSVGALGIARISVAAVKVEAGARITDIRVPSGTTGATAPTLIQFMLLDPVTRAVLAVTADDSAAGWSNSTDKALPITGGPYVVDDDALLLVGVVVSATTVPTLLGFAVLGVAAAASDPPITAYSSASTYTTPVTVGTVVALTTTGSIAFQRFYAELVGS